MTQNYQRIGDYISLVDERNTYGSITLLMGISIDKCYIKSVANVIGTDLHNYKVIRKGLFACSLMQVSRDQKIPIALYTSETPAIMSPAYVLFEVKNTDKLLPEYLNLWFMRAEFDREASFYAVGGVRGSLDWEDFCNMRLPIPSIDEQLKIVHAFNVVDERISLLKKINNNLEAQAIAICNNSFPISEDKDENGIVADICLNIYSGGTPATSEDDYWDGELSWLSSGETSNSYVTKTEKHISLAGVQNSSTKLAKAGCTVIASAGQGKTRGQASLLYIDTYVNQSVVVLQPKKGYEYILFSNLKNRYEEMRQLSDLDSIRGSLTTKTIGSLPFRKHRDETINRKLAVLFEMIKHNCFELDKLENLNALMSHGML